MSRLAWFSPLPPSTSGIAAYSAELLPRLRARGHAIDTFTDATAHDFVWKQRRNAYDLTLFQLGNAACHDYMWAYLFRYPGLVTLHDAQLHQARALFLTKRWQPRRLDYLAEFRANHPEAPEDAGELVAAGLGGSLYHHWPLVRLVLESTRMTLVHNVRLRDELREKYPQARIESLEMGVADPMITSGGPDHLRQEHGGPSKHLAQADGPPRQAAILRSQHGIPQRAIVLAAFGGVTPEKRIPVVLRALSAIAERHPLLHLMLIGSTADHYDVVEDARRWGVADRVHVTGFVTDEEFLAHLRAADICACLRWPTNRETSASWLRCIAAARTTIITDLSHLDLPTLDPRGWQVLDTASPPREAVAVSIDILDEEHSLQLAIERLATDAAMRDRIGRAARAWYEAHHRLEPMVDEYDRAITSAIRCSRPDVGLPAHLTEDGTRQARALANVAGVGDRAADLFRD